MIQLSTNQLNVKKISPYLWVCYVKTLIPFESKIEISGKTEVEATEKMLRFFEGKYDLVERWMSGDEICYRVNKID